MGSAGVLYMIDEWQRRLDRQGWNVVEMSVGWKKSGGWMEMRDFDGGRKLRSACCGSV
jgi:hypothetical protein